MSIIEHLIERHVRQPVREAVRGAMSRWCSGCQKKMPLVHTCEIKTDFKSRRRQADRRPARRRTRAKGKKTASKPAERHDYRACDDQDCQRRLCIVYREGQQDCPLPHI